MIKFGVSLLSGGLDSTTVTAYAKGQSDQLTALTFRYGQTHSKEIDCALEIASQLKIEHKLIDISFLNQIAWYSALTNPQAFPVPKSSNIADTGYSIPITYVPLRNTIFLSLSAAFLESQVLHAIEVEGLRSKDIHPCIYMAPNAIDYSGYPDCRPEFFEQVKQTLRYGSKLGTEYGIYIQIETPIISMSKGDIVQMATDLKVPLEHTWSCYKGGEFPCRSCDSCILRAKGFEQARKSDPLLTRLGRS